MDLFWLGGEGPKDIPSWVYLHLVTRLEEPPEKISGLRSVQKVGFWDGKPVTFFRIYDPRSSDEALRVSDFTYLDRRPHLVLYEGYCEKESNEVYLLNKGDARAR